MIGTQTVFVVAIVDRDLDRHRCVYQANDSGRDADEVGVSSVSGTSESRRTNKVSSSLTGDNH